MLCDDFLPTSLLLCRFCIQVPSLITVSVIFLISACHSLTLNSSLCKSRPPPLYTQYGTTEPAQMAYTSYSHPSYDYGQGPKDSYAVQYDIAQRVVVTGEQWDEQYGDNSMASCGRNNSNISDISGVSLSSSNHTYASTPSPTTPTGNLDLGGYSTPTKTEYRRSSLTPSPWDSQFTTFDQSDSMRWTPSALGWMPNSELLKLYKFVVRGSKEPYFLLMGQWTPTPQTPAKVYLDNPE